jgi:predicted RNase H-like nuclease (RuvC/YqgF family)
LARERCAPHNTGQEFFGLFTSSSILKGENTMTEKRDAYVQQLKAKLDEWNAEIDKLQAKADQAEAGAKIEYQEQIEDLQAKRKDVEAKIAEMQEAGEGAWEDLRQGLENSWEILKGAFAKAKSRFEKEEK